MIAIASQTHVCITECIEEITINLTKLSKYLGSILDVGSSSLGKDCYVRNQKVVAVNNEKRTLRVEGARHNTIRSRNRGQNRVFGSSL